MPFQWRAPLIEMGRERREFFPENAGKGSLLSRYEAERGSSGCGRDSSASSRVETSMSGNFLSYIKGFKDPFETEEGSWDFSLDTAVEKGLISH